MQRPKWDRHSIKAEVHRRGETLTGLAIDAGIDESSCRLALCRRNIRGEEVIAAFLGVPLIELWPDRYGEKRKTIAERRAEASQKRASAADIGEAA